MHMTEVLPEAGVITDMVNSYKSLGLEVRIAEMDAVIYGAVVDEALHAGITDIHFWGFTDGHNYTWVDHAGPLMFDKQYHAKPAFYATHDALAKFVN
ncbi:Exoglucanase XynX [Beauveria bassiana]|uniref:Exoglucanase XynX n=1 Tax=Beauveria bassiana TaxID=176275 RepID=A0A2N6ND00_BEABA|nr:Exoglucanase XynX [Beauveria bassiana]